MWVSGSTSSRLRAITSSITSGPTIDSSASVTAAVHGCIFSVSEPGRKPRSWPPTANSGRNTVTRLCVRCSSTASRPAASASTLLPVPALPPRLTIPTSGSASRSTAMRCSAERPCTSKSCAIAAHEVQPLVRRGPGRAPTATRRAARRPCCRAAHGPRRGRSPGRRTARRSPSGRRRARRSRSSSESIASSLRYSSASSPTIAALSRSGRSLVTTVTVVTLGGQVAGDGQDAVVVVVAARATWGRPARSWWLISTRSVPPCVVDRQSGGQRAVRECAAPRAAAAPARAVQPSSGWLRLASSSVSTTNGRTMSCSSKRVSALGSASSTDVSST